MNIRLGLDHTLYVSASDLLRCGLNRSETDIKLQNKLVSLISGGTLFVFNISLEIWSTSINIKQWGQ